MWKKTKSSASTILQHLWKRWQNKPRSYWGKTVSTKHYILWRLWWIPSGHGTKIRASHAEEERSQDRKSLNDQKSPCVVNLLTWSTEKRRNVLNRTKAISESKISRVRREELFKILHNVWRGNEIQLENWKQSQQGLNCSRKREDDKGRGRVKDFKSQLHSAVLPAPFEAGTVQTEVMSEQVSDVNHFHQKPRKVHARCALSWKIYGN